MSHTIYKENDNIYLNVVIGGNAKSESPVVAEYNVTKTMPILDKCSDYYASVIRFDIPMNEVPILIAPIVPNQGNPNLMQLKIGITNGGTDYVQNLIYSPDNVLPSPIQNQSTQVITEYYFIYTYGNMINSMNNGLQSAFVAAGSPGGGIAPFILFDSVVQSLNLVVSNAFIVSGAQIFWNEWFNNFFDSVRDKFYGYNRPNGKDFIVNITPYPGQTNKFIVPSDPTGLYFIFKNEYNVINYWNSLRKIVIASSTLPIVSENVPAYNPDGSQSDVAASFPILTDFVPNLEYSGQSRSIAYYTPTSQYRLVDMLSDNPLYRVDLRLYWQDKSGNLYPITISVQQQASIKIAFLRKSLYKNMSQLIKK